MKIKDLGDLGDLEEKIDRELSWRKKELTAIKADVESSMEKEPSEQSRAIRSGIAMLYAHWEGSVKSIAEYYLIYVSSLNLKYSELKNNFMAIAIRKSLEECAKTKKATIHNKLIDDIYSKKSEISDIPYKNIIKTDSNLKMDIFREIAATIGIDDSPYMLKGKIIDGRLLGNRNKIVHGERIEQLEGISEASDYIELHEIVLKLIDDFAQNIRHTAQNEKYRA